MYQYIKWSLHIIEYPLYASVTSVTIHTAGHAAVHTNP